MIFKYILIISVMFNIFIISLVLIGIYFLIPDSEKKKGFYKYVISKIDKITNSNVNISIFILLIGLIVVLSLSSTINISFWDEKTRENLFYELVGMLFDILILVLLMNYLGNKTIKKERIKRLKDDLDYYRHWKSIEAQFLLRSIIYKLNEENIYEINLVDVNISFIPQDDQPKLPFDHINLNGSRLHKTDFSNLNMHDSLFEGIIDHFSIFNGTGLIRCSFKGAHLQGTIFDYAFLFEADFSNATITGDTSFRNANLRFAKFDNTIIESIDLEDAIVTEDFFEILSRSNIQGINISENYEIISELIRRENNSFQYRLRIRDS